MLQGGELYRIISSKTTAKQSDCAFILLKPYCGQRERVASGLKKLWLQTGGSSPRSQMSLSKWDGDMCHWRAHALLFQRVWKIVQKPQLHREVPNLCLLVGVPGQDVYVNTTTANGPWTQYLFAKFWESLGLILPLYVSLSKKKGKIMSKDWRRKKYPFLLIRLIFKCQQ